MRIQILGSGCDKCKKLTANVQEVNTKFDLGYDIEKVTDINRIIEFGVMTTPALVVDGKVVSVGKVLSPDEAAVFLRAPDDSDSPQKSCCSPDTNTGKKFLTILLLLFVISSVSFMLFREIRASGTKAKIGIAETANRTIVQSNVLTVYYFHRTKRCISCNAIENLTRTALTSKYAKALSDGSMVFKSVAIDTPENQHFIKDFELSSGTVVLQKNGQYEKLDQVWTLVREPEKFTAYVEERTAKLIAAEK